MHVVPSGDLHHLAAPMLVVSFLHNPAACSLAAVLTIAAHAAATPYWLLGKISTNRLCFFQWQTSAQHSQLDALARP